MIGKINNDCRLDKIAGRILIVLTGPTAVGKTDVAIRLSQKYQGLVISADSRQVYKELSIGTAKPSQLEIKQGNMRLVNHISVTEPYSAGHFEKEALAVIEEAKTAGLLPILCGGTGLYIKAVCEGLDSFPLVPKSYVTAIEAELDAGNLEALLEEIGSKDPIALSKMEKQNRHRLIRILSIIRSSGKPYSSFLNKEKGVRQFKPVYIVLDLPRTELYDRINLRVLKMIEAGLIEEVKSLSDMRQLQALNTVGYSEVFSYLDGTISKEECIAQIQMNSRRYAKRQMTWFRNQMTAKHFSATDFNAICDYIDKQLITA